ncbi:MAG TPA: NAD(P)-dependent oxidoreductase [Chitinophagaceae bacterium]|nr:NAD(P)-dependent oxidoreductase [Chitinophagales bacterium]HMZ99458.1 NAD(P)-dependent oxidoreductase [Ferruginibacter sp.]HNF72528.1 NAD(P)-dependent oxidoreductase [Chitinophagaceae bacterium]HNA15296.1 NAD(P)-dependent oxidoreductase [Ferruginibacter sp.]HNF01670.1 NAD(P)-dependent oxidoreductase [Ferruginibacter sp.]
MNKKILITGGSGLVGSDLVSALLEKGGYELFLVGRNETLPEYNDKVKKIKIDFAADWNESELPPDLYAIIHLSQAENFRDFPGKAKEVFYINTLSTLRLVDHATKSKINHFIFASSGGVYGTDGMFREDDRGGYTKEMGFYLGTKYCSEVLLENYFDLLNVIILRFFFVYGKGQNQSMLIPRLISRVKDGESITLQGQSGMKINPVHVSDATKAIIASLNLQGSHKLNVAGPEVLSLREIGEKIGTAVGRIPQFSIDETIVPKNLIGDLSKMKELLINPSIKFEDGIKTMI